MDDRRRSVLEANVSTLRAWGAGSVQKAANVGEIKKVEEEIEKVEKEIVAEVIKETGKVKRGAKKAKKEVAAVVEKPVRARRKKKASAD